MKFECVWVKLIIMNVNEIIKIERNLDEGALSWLNQERFPY